MSKMGSQLSLPGWTANLIPVTATGSARVKIHGFGHCQRPCCTSATVATISVCLKHCSESFSEGVTRWVLRTWLQDSGSNLCFIQSRRSGCSLLYSDRETHWTVIAISFWDPITIAYYESVAKASAADDLLHHTQLSLFVESLSYPARLFWSNIILTNLVRWTSWGLGEDFQTRALVRKLTAPIMTSSSSSPFNVDGRFMGRWWARGDRVQDTSLSDTIR